MLWVTDHLVGLKLSAAEEAVGLDLSQFIAPSSEPPEATPASWAVAPLPRRATTSPERDPGSVI